MIRPSKLIFIRHAPVKKIKNHLPDHDAEAVINYDHIENVALNIPEGAIWYVSPLRRTVQTAKALTKFVTYKKIINDENLVEQNFGDWEGRKISDVWNELKENKSQHNFSFTCPETIPPNGDSFLDQCKRMSLWLEELKFPMSETTVVVTHGGTIRAALTYILGLTPDKAIGVEILPLSLNLFEVLSNSDAKERGGRFRMLGLNKLLIDQR